MSFPLASCTVTDVPGLMEVYTSAFKNDPTTPVCLPPTIPRAEYARWLRQRLTAAFKQPGIEHWKITDEKTGKLVAWCRWEFPRVLAPEQEAEEKKNEVKVELPEGAGVEFWDSIITGIERMRGMYVEKGTMHIVQFLCVAQEYQGLGLGSKLLRHGLALADASDSRVYIEATAAGHPVYLKFGWRDVDVLTHDLAKFGGSGMAYHRIMTREARGKVAD